MWVSLKEAAAKLGKSERQVRYAMQQGDLAARKVHGRWTIDLQSAAPFDPPRAAVQDRQRQALREVIDRTLGFDEDQPHRRYSLQDLKAYQIARPLYFRLCESQPADHPARRPFDRALELLALGCHRYDREQKADAYREARDALSMVVLHLDLARDEHCAAIAQAIEQDLMAAMAGLLRRFERKRVRS